MIRIGMIGGGQGAFIGAVHRIALAMDGEFRLVAGCFSRSIENTRATGAELGLHEDRLYESWEAMLTAESALPEKERIEAVAIVTPNHVHHGPAKAFLEAGFHVICDKPLTTSIELAEDLAQVAAQSEGHFALTHNYTGYPMVREAKERIARGELGSLRKVAVEYLQGWLSTPLEKTGHKQAAWRSDPSMSGPVGALGDIGTHAFNLLEHVTGLQVRSLFAVLQSVVEDRALDDDDMMLLRMDEGVSGTLCASQVCYGQENSLTLRIWGSKGALLWRQEHPNDLELTEEDGSRRLLRCATEATGEASRSLTRIPPGHPEGYLEGFANIYRAFARKIRNEDDLEASHPTVDDGVRGLRFIQACLDSSAESRWVEL